MNTDFSEENFADYLPQKKRIFIVSSIFEDFGGSETIWYDLVKQLPSSRYQIFFLKSNINRSHPVFKDISNRGVLLVELEPNLGIKDGKKTKSKLNHKAANFCIHLEVYKPDLVIINQGMNFDGLDFAHYCIEQNFQYITISNKAVDFFWPYPENRNDFKQFFIKSKVNYFVSNHNYQLTCEQFGMKIPHAERAIYPVKKHSEIKPLPDLDDGVKFAVVGRLFLLDKGHDMLFRILSKPIWRNRKIKVSIIGTGSDDVALKEFSEYLKLDSVDFLGYMNNQTIWDHFHGLLLPSRSEGFPLVVQEAMSASRIVITTFSGGSDEVIKDGVNGFISEIDQDEFELAMERCWNAQNNWADIATEAYKTINEFLPDNPSSNILDQIEKLTFGTIDDSVNPANQFNSVNPAKLFL